MYVGKNINVFANKTLGAKFWETFNWEILVSKHCISSLLHFIPYLIDQIDRNLKNIESRRGTLRCTKLCQWHKRVSQPKKDFKCLLCTVRYLLLLW